MLPRSSHHCWLPPVQAAARKWPQPGPGCMGEHLSCTAGPELRAGTWRAAVLQVCPDTRTEPLLGHRIPFSTEGCTLPQSVQGLPPTAEESAPVVRSNSEREPRASLKLQCVLSARAPRLCLAPLQDTEEHRGSTAPQRVPGSEFHQRR